MPALRAVALSSLLVLAAARTAPEAPRPAAPPRETPTNPVIPATPPSAATPVTSPTTAGGASAQTTAPSTAPATAPATRPAVPLPAKWHGKFVGKLDLMSLDRPGVVQNVGAELEIRPIEGRPADVTWTLTYVAEQRQVRAYELKAVPGFAGRFLMDEKNGILIDNVLYADTLACQFTVANNLLTATYELREDGVFFEVVTSGLARPRRSGVDGTDFKVDSYPVRSVQRGLLKRVE